MRMLQELQDGCWSYCSVNDAGNGGGGGLGGGGVVGTSGVWGMGQDGSALTLTRKQ
jgi:hypothetical protein